MAHSSDTIIAKYMDLTPTEVKIADLIRQGIRSKEIADMLEMSPGSVYWYRNNIRKKLGLSHKKTNLRNYLNSLIP